MKLKRRETAIGYIVTVSLMLLWCNSIMDFCDLPTLHPIITVLAMFLIIISMLYQREIDRYILKCKAEKLARLRKIQREQEFLREYEKFRIEYHK